MAGIHRVERSRLGACHRSRLGVLGRSPGIPEFPEFLIAFIDESSPYQIFELWDQDLDFWNQTILEHGFPRYGLALLDLESPLFPTSDNVKPFGVPEGIDPFDVARPPPVEVIVDIHEEVTEGVVPPLVTILVDNSGSMTRATVAGELESYEQWLDNGGTFVPDAGDPRPPIPWQEVLWDDENWLRQIANYISEREQ